jgi:hypothetical protein
MYLKFALPVAKLLQGTPEEAVFRTYENLNSKRHYAGGNIPFACCLIARQAWVHLGAYFGFACGLQVARYH